MFYISIPMCFFPLIAVVLEVTEQHIKPVTREAGKMSWALMLNPRGLDCDLFISHWILERMAGGPFFLGAEKWMTWHNSGTCCNFGEMVDMLEN